MMAPDLSRRLGRAFQFEPLVILTIAQRVLFMQRNDGAQTITDLQPADQQLVLKSEGNDPSKENQHA